MRRLAHDVRFSFRSLWRTPGITAAALACLMLGIAINTSMFSVLNGILWRPLPLPDSDRVVTLWDKGDDDSRRNMGYETILDVRRGASSLGSVAAVRPWSPRVTGHQGPERLAGVAVTHEFFDVIGVHPALGRAFSAEEDRPGNDAFVVLSDDLWRRRFNADASVIGRTVNMGGVDCVILGVMPRDFQPVVSEAFYRRADIWAPLGYVEGGDSACRGCRHLRVVARLTPDATLERAQQELNTIAAELRANFPNVYVSDEFGISSLQDHLVGDTRLALQVLFGAVGFIMLIACANVANLLLTRSNLRRREFAIRSALGASRRRIVQQLFVEGVLLGLMAAGGGLAVSIWGIEGLRWLAPDSLPRIAEIAIDARVLAFTVGLAVVTGVVFSLAPALEAIRTNVAGALKQESHSSAGIARRGTRQMLVVSEIALAIVLLVGGGLFLRSFTRLSQVDPGFEPEGIMSFRLVAPFADYPEDESRLAFYAEVNRRIEAMPRVTGVSVVSTLPFGGDYDRIGIGDASLGPTLPPDAPSPDRYIIDPDYFGVMGIPLLQGRLFDERDDADAPAVVVINRTLAHHLWAEDDPLGRRVRMGGGPDAPVWTVVGVVGDVLHHGLEDGPTMQVYLAHPQRPTNFMNLVVRSRGDARTLLEPIRSEIWAINGSVPVQDVRLMPELLAQSLGEQRFTMSLVGGFATVAILLAGFGLYAVMAFGVAQRRKEIGIRVALGATRHDVVGLVIREGLVMAGMGLAIGLLGAWALSHSMSGMLYGVAPGDPITYVLTASGVFVVAAAASLAPALHASKTNPVIALRGD